MIQKLKGDDCVWFYCQGWRIGKIVKRYSGKTVTVQDCTQRRYRVRKNKKGEWVALANKEV